MKSEQDKLSRELKQSGQSIAEFGREKNIPLHRLYELSSAAKKRTGKRCKFVRVSGGTNVRIYVNESVQLEVPVESLREVLCALGVSL
jgi:hypothetical protein